ncbi:hypothetical protein V498_04716 [Pseudogymnoascus sp. VKM F-4517 (FW-2822)]|nr:hypothetical protein V498_04716 [Pseudogymnoascus sp. VKM F-4517 (FW-2822)]
MATPTQAKSSDQEAATSSNVLYATLYRRLHGMTSRRDCTPNSRKLTPYEESALVQYILDLDSRGFPPRPQDVQEMADLLLAERGKSPTRKNWATNFITCRTELKAKFSRKYDYKRAKCKDPKIIQEWFSLVRNTVAKYRILEQDIYNFNKAGFAIGVIATAKLEFLSAFKEAFKATFTEQNIKSGFQATGLVPYKPQNVLSYLNLRLRTPTPPIVESGNWTLKTPQTIRELNFQTEHIKNRIAEVKALQAANEQKKRRERKRKRRIMQGGSLSVREGEDILQSAEVDAQLRTEVASETTRQVGSTGQQRRCGTCGNMGHNSRTCTRHEDLIAIE